MAIVGVISYRIAGDGCLIGKYQNNGLEPQTECLAKLDKDHPNIEGTYQAAWTEGRSSKGGKVFIDKVGSGFKMRWEQNNGTVLYWGHSMLDSEGSLVACYWDNDVETQSNIYRNIK